VAPSPALDVKEEPVAAPAVEDAAPAALASNDEPVAVAPAPLPAASKVAPIAPRPIARASAPAVQPPTNLAKPLASAGPKISPKPAAKIAAARAKPLPRAAAATASAGSAPTHGVIDLAAYRNALLAKISSAVRYPEAARGRGASGVAAVNFALDAAGDVTLAQLTRSSGDGELDAEAIAAVRRASPLPAPPADAPRAYVAPIRFELH
jgi:TonB family protein